MRQLYLFEGIAANAPEGSGLLGELRLFSVVGDAVLQNEIDVVKELEPVVVLVRFDFLGHRFQIHRVLDDAVIILDELFVDRLEERPGLWQGLQFPVDHAVQDVGEGHLVVVIQQRIDRLFQPHETLLFLAQSLDANVQHPLGGRRQDALLPVVQRRILNNQIDVRQKVFSALVAFLAERFADRLQVHRPQDDPVIVRHRFAADWEQERLDVWKFAHFVEDFFQHGGHCHHGIGPSPVGRSAVPAQVIAMRHSSGPSPLPSGHGFLGY